MKKTLIPLLLVAIICACKKQTGDSNIQNPFPEVRSAPPPPGNYWSFRLNAPTALADRSGMTCFVIGNKAYVMGGYDHQTGGSAKKDLWEYDPVTNVYTQKASLPPSAAGRLEAASFSINGKGYVATGLGTPPLRDLWEYDPGTNSWTQKADLPGLPRCRAVGFAINGKGYIATGNDFTGSLKDVWEYNPGSDSWIQKANMPTFSGREHAFVFVFNNKAYIGGGYNPATKTMYEFDPAAGANGIWTQKASYPGQATRNIAAFSTNLAGFAGTGSYLGGMFTFYKDFWRYSISSNTWTNKPDFPGVARHWAMGFSINGIGYMGLGRDENTLTNNGDLYKYVQ